MAFTNPITETGVDQATMIEYLATFQAAVEGFLMKLDADIAAGGASDTDYRAAFTSQIASGSVPTSTRLTYTTVADAVRDYSA